MTSPTEREQIVEALTHASWPDRGRDGFPSLVVARMLADVLAPMLVEAERRGIHKAADWLRNSGSGAYRSAASSVLEALDPKPRPEPPAGPCHGTHHDPMCAVLLRHQACNQGAG